MSASRRVEGTDKPLFRVEIIAPVHNRKDVTLQALHSLSGVDKGGLAIHIIIVDDGSTDGTSEAIRNEFPDVQIVRGDGNLWYTGGIKAGISAALANTPNYLVLINDDSLFAPSSVVSLVTCVIEHPRSIVGATLVSWDQRDRIFQVGARWDTWFGGWRHPQHLTLGDLPEHPFPVEVIAGNCVLIPVEAVNQVGLPNEKVSPLYADAEYTTRMRKAGWDLLIEPKAIVYCQPNAIRTSLRDLNWRKRLRLLLFDSHAPENLLHQLRLKYFTAPTRPQGIIAFAIAEFRLLLKALKLGGSWPNWPDPPLDILAPLRRRSGNYS